ncbi:MAG TPA: YgiT-type zinc finger protein [Spirochaetota bacterium]|nr:YgiT-type zinc finger protein [Spirochaetota bacterium]HQP50363.1 YgiT-type zinc finger protein [Spirochaetota bacterium]
MIPFKTCPVCNGEIIEKEVEKLLRGGENTASIMVKTEVCLHCGERLYSPEIIKKFDEIRLKLKSGDVKDFEPSGQFFRVAS